MPISFPGSALGRGAERFLDGLFSTPVGRKAGATNPTDPADQSIHPSTSAPARIWPQGGLALQRWICVSGNRQSWEEAPLARRSSASTTKLRQADSHCLFLFSSHVTYAHAQRRRKRTSPSTDSRRSLRLQHCAEAQTLDWTGPTRASPFPSHSAHPGPGATTIHTTTRQSTPLCQHCSRARINPSHLVSTRPAMPANTLAHRTGGSEKQGTWPE